MTDAVWYVSVVRPNAYVEIVEIMHWFSLLAFWLLRVFCMHFEAIHSTFIMLVSIYSARYRVIRAINRITSASPFITFLARGTITWEARKRYAISHLQKQRCKITQPMLANAQALLFNNLAKAWNDINFLPKR